MHLFIKQKNKSYLPAVIIIFIAVAITILYLYLHNFSEVIPNQFYRSRQLSAPELSQAIKQYNLKTVINLRGAHPDQTWYHQEIFVTNTMHVQHEDFALKSKVLPDKQTLLNLIRAIQNDPRPILVHCQSGVDRSGLVSAIAILLTPNGTLDQAWEQESIKHFVLSPQSVGKQFLEKYQSWLQSEHYSTTPELFLYWTKQVYGSSSVPKSSS